MIIDVEPLVIVTNDYRKAWIDAREMGWRPHEFKIVTSYYGVVGHQASSFVQLIYPTPNGLLGELMMIVNHLRGHGAKELDRLPERRRTA